MCDRQAYRKPEPPKKPELVYEEYLKNIEEWKKRQKPDADPGDEFIRENFR